MIYRLPDPFRFCRLFYFARQSSLRSPAVGSVWSRNNGRLDSLICQLDFQLDLFSLREATEPAHVDDALEVN